MPAPLPATTREILVERLTTDPSTPDVALARQIGVGMATVNGLRHRLELAGALPAPLEGWRRNGSRAIRRDRIAAELRRTPNYADRRIAQALKVGAAAVASVRRALEATGEIEAQPVRLGRDGVPRRVGRRP